MNPYLVVVLAALAGQFLLQAIADSLNLRVMDTRIPVKLQDVYDSERYARSQAYLRDKTRLGLLGDVVEFVIEIAFILLGGFYLIDRWLRGFELGPIWTGLLFAGILLLGARLVDLPFAVYRTFVIESRYDFNRTTVRTYILDILRAVLLTVVLGGPLLAAVFWLFGRYPSTAWLLAWAVVGGFQALMVFLAPYVIMPLFNRFTPLEAGPLRDMIEAYARDQAFPNRGVFTMDGSRRSSKSNAFFTGFGRSRRIVLFDTLLERHPPEEVVAIVAHEMGHCKKGHIAWAIVRSLAAMGLTLFVLSRFIGNAQLLAAFRFPAEQVSVYAGLVCFAFLYTPVALVIGLVEHWISRRQEYAADAFVAETAPSPTAIVPALKTLTSDNLGNLTPHPIKVAISYSHPPLLARVAAIETRLGSTTGPRPAPPLPDPSH